MNARTLAAVTAAALLLSLSACAPQEPEPTATPTPTVDPASLVTELCHVEHDRPEDYRLDITLPMLREGLPGAAELNAQIAADYDYYLNTPPEDYMAGDACLNFDYSMIHIWYEVYAFDRVYELVVRYQEYSLYGSGLFSFNTIYGYDSASGAALSLQELMERVGITEDAVCAAYAAEDPDGAAFEDLIHFFYFDEQKQIHIAANQ